MEIGEREPAKGLLRERTKHFALRVIRVFAALPSLKEREEGRVIGRQMLRSGTSVGAQYREASRARTAAEFISKMESALQELDETSYWLELLVEASILPEGRLADLRAEANELTAMFVASINTAKGR